MSHRQAGVRYATKEPPELLPRDPASYVSSNVAGFVQLLEACRFCPLDKVDHLSSVSTMTGPRVVYASSSSVYGLNTVSPFSEEHQVDRPASLYAATKKANEMIAHTYHHIYGLSLTGLRFFTVYGPWGRPDMFAFSATIKIHKGEALKIFQGPGGSELERDFTFIDDIVTGCVASVDKIPESTKGAAHYKVYNLGNKDPVTVTYMIECLERAIGKKAIKNYVPMPPTGDVLKTSADISLAEKELGYKPTTSLQEGINKFIAWYDEYYKSGLTKEMSNYEWLKHFACRVLRTGFRMWSWKRCLSEKKLADGMSKRGLTSSKSEAGLRMRLGTVAPVPAPVAESGGYPPRRPSSMSKSRTNSGRLSSPQDIDHPWETCPFRTLFLVIQDMMALKYGLQLDEPDFDRRPGASIPAYAVASQTFGLREWQARAGLELNSTALALDALMEPDLVPSRSLAWLWQTVAATCCWALSDVICDACIRPPATEGDAEPSPPTEAPKSGLRRRRPKALGTEVEGPGKNLRRVGSPRLRPCTQLVPEVPALDWQLDSPKEESRSA
ncbi:unnamed protein product [Effrenium voratum]|nr:unnamed protein product [Effrenium voratum]